MVSIGSRGKEREAKSFEPPPRGDIRLTLRGRPRWPSVLRASTKPTNLSYRCSGLKSATGFSVSLMPPCIGPSETALQTTCTVRRLTAKWPRCSLGVGSHTCGACPKRRLRGKRILGRASRLLGRNCRKFAKRLDLSALVECLQDGGK